MDRNKKITQSLLIFVYTLVWSSSLFIETFSKDVYDLIPLLFLLAAAVLSGLCLFSSSMDGHRYCRFQMIAAALLCASSLGQGIILTLKEKTFSADILLVAAFVLFLIAAFLEPEDKSWRVLNYVAHSFLAFLSLVPAALLLSAGIIVSAVSPLGMIVSLLGLLGYGTLASYDIVSLVYVKYQPLNF